ADAGPDLEMQIHAVTRYLVPHHREFQRFVRAFTLNADMDCSSFRSFQEISHIARAHVVGRFSIHGHNNVARTNASPIGRSSHKWSDDDNFVIARTHRHADAVVLAALIFAQQG